MRDMQEFYKKYNLNSTYFGEMAHVGARTLRKYSDGEPIRDDSRERIEKAISVVEKYNCIRPKCDAKPGDTPRYARHFQAVTQYNKNFADLLAKEGS